MHWKSNRRSAGNAASSTAAASPTTPSASTSSSSDSSAEDEASGSGSSLPIMSPLSDGGASLLTMIKWSDEGQYLKDFLQKYQTLPQVARIIKGQYMTLGVSSLSSSSSLHQTIFLCSKAKRIKVAAQCVKFKEGKKVVPVGPRIAIPDNYEGWFEILSEEGKAVRCIESVAELARRFPDSCLVRENVKAYVAKGDELEIITDRVRTINAGETLVLLSEVVGSSANNHSDKINNNNTSTRGRFLRCFDAKGENVYLSFDQRGKFSLVAKEDNISGVHSIKNLLTKRFPLMVRLVTGKTPLGGKIGSNFVPEMRLYASFEEECVMALPLQSKVSDSLAASSMVAVPVSVPLKLQAWRNPELLTTVKEYGRLQEECKTLMEDSDDAIQVFETETNGSKEPARQEIALYRKLPYFRRAFSDPSGSRLCRVSDVERIYRKQQIESADSQQVDSGQHDDRYNEIDQIYDYVRGFAPLPKSADVKPTTSEEDDDDEEEAAAEEVRDSGAEEKSSPEESTKPPDPPPIETIPARISRNLAHTVHPVRVMQVAKRPSIENHYERIPRVGGRFYSRDSRSAGSKLSKLYAGKSNNNGSGVVNNPLQRHHHHHHNGSQNGFKSSSSASSTAAKLFRQHQRSGHLNDAPYPVLGFRGSVKSSATSPLFNIRYKSLTNLTSLEFNTLDSSNSGGGFTSNASSYIMEEAGHGTPALQQQQQQQQRQQKTHKRQLLHLGRPKSLTSLGLLQCKDNRNYYHQLQPVQQQRHLLLHDYNRANLLNNVICQQQPSSKSKEQKDKNILISAANNNNSLKRIGTLYL